MFNVEEFFDKINENNWRHNIDSEVEIAFDSVIEALQENKEEMIKEITEDIERIELLKLEDNEKFNYPIVKKWISYFVKQTLSDRITDE